MADTQEPREGRSRDDSPVLGPGAKGDPDNPEVREDRAENTSNEPAVHGDQRDDNEGDTKRRRTAYPTNTATSTADTESASTTDRR